MAKFRQLYRDASDLGLRPQIVGILLGLQFLAIVSEGAGIAMLAPVLQYMQENGDIAVLVAENRYWQVLIDVYGSVSLAPSLAVLLCTSFFFILLRQVLTYVQLAYRAHARQRTAHALRLRAFDGYLHTASLYHDDQRQGEFVNDMTVEMRIAVNALFDTVLVLGSALLVIAYLVGLLALSPWMTLIALLVLALCSVLILRLLRRTKETSKAITRANKDFTAFLVERLKSVRLIRLSGSEQVEQKALTRLSGEHRHQTVRLQILSARIKVVVEPIAVGVALLVLYVGYRFADMPLETLGIFLLVLMRLLPVMKDMLGNYQTVLGQWASLRAVMTRLREMEAVRQDTALGVEFGGFEKALIFDDVSFTYPTRNDKALHHVSLTFAKGRVTALVGPSGAGKSTLINMLPRLRSPDAGRILFDEADIAEMSLSSLRKAIAYVSQTPFLLDISAGEYISYGSPGAELPAIRDAAYMAAASDFIEELPEGYDTPLGENGNRLSGGQKQRLDLARALLQKAPILILDEPVSHLDPGSEAAVAESLRRIRNDTDITVILISHEPKTVRDADQIAVIEAGRITAVGDHETLMRSSLWYRNTFVNATESAVA